jgi:hypothetical protein
MVDNQRWNPTVAAPGQYRWLETLANEWDVWDHGADDSYK